MAASSKHRVLCCSACSGLGCSLQHSSTHAARLLLVNCTCAATRCRHAAATGAGRAGSGRCRAPEESLRPLRVAGSHSCAACTSVTSTQCCKHGSSCCAAFKATCKNQQVCKHQHTLAKRQRHAQLMCAGRCRRSVSCMQVSAPRTCCGSSAWALRWEAISSQPRSSCSPVCSSAEGPAGSTLAWPSAKQICSASSSSSKGAASASVRAAGAVVMATHPTHLEEALGQDSRVLRSCCAVRLFSAAGRAMETVSGC